MDENNTLEMSIEASANDAIQEIRSINVELSKLQKTLKSIDTNALHTQFDTILEQLGRMENRHITLGLTSYEAGKIDDLFNKIRLIGDALTSRGEDMKAQMEQAVQYTERLHDATLENSQMPEISKKNPTLTYLNGEILKFEQQINKALAELQKLADIGINSNLTDQQIERAQHLARQIELLSDEQSKYNRIANVRFGQNLGVNIEPIQRSSDAIMQLIANLNEYKAGVDASTLDTSQYNAEVEKLSRKLNTLYGQLSKLYKKSETDILSDNDIERVQHLKTQFAYLERTLRGTFNYDTKTYNSVFSRMFSGIDSNVTNKVGELAAQRKADAEAAKQQAAAARQNEAELNKTRRDIDAVLTNLSRLEKYNNIRMKIGLDDIQAEKVIQTRAELERLFTQLDNAQVDTTRFREIYANIAEGLESPIIKTEEVTEATYGWRDAVNSIRNAISGIGTVLSFVSAGLRIVLNVARRLWNAFRTIWQVVRRLVSSIASMARHLFSSSKHAGSLSRFLSMASRMALRRLIQSVFKDFSEGFQALARHSASFNAALSQVKASLYEIRNATVSALAPLIEIIGPVVTKLVNWIVAGIDKIGQALSALNGQNTYKRLKMGAYDYAKSLDKANKSQRQLVSGLDEINKLTDNKNDDDNPLQFYIEEKVIDKDINKVFKHIRDLWTNGEYRETGRYIAQQANKWLVGIDFSQVQIKLTGFADRVVSAINGFFEEIDGDTLGEKIGEAVNTGLEFINKFVNGIKWHDMFTKMGDAIKSFFKTVDADQVADLVVGIASVVSEFLLMIFDVIGSPEVTDKLYLIIDKVTGRLNDALNDVEKRQHFTEMLGNAIASVINIVSYAISSIDWGALSTAVQEVINVAMQGTNAENIGAALGGIGGFVLNIVNDLPWGAIVDKVKEGLSGLGGVLSDIIGDDIEEIGLIARHTYLKIDDERYGAMAKRLEEFMDEADVARILNGQMNWDVEKGSHWEGIWNIIDYTPKISFKQFEGENKGLLGEFSIDELVKKYGSTFTSELMTALSNGTYSVDEFAKKWKEKSIEFANKWSDELIIAVGDNTSTTEAFHVGGQITSGIYEGMISEIDTNSETYALDVLRAIREAMGIHSPSTLMRDDVGVYLGEGIGTGLLSAIPYVVQCAQAVVNAIRAVFNGTSINYGVTTGTSGYGLSMPGIPAMVAQVAAGRGGQTESYMGILSQLLYAVQQGKDIYMDGRMLTDMVTKRQRLNAKASGRPVYMSY